MDGRWDNPRFRESCQGAMGSTQIDRDHNTQHHTPPAQIRMDIRTVKVEILTGAMSSLRRKAMPLSHSPLSVPQGSQRRQLENDMARRFQGQTHSDIDFLLCPGFILV